jgi:hypothetical protein
MNYAKSVVKHSTIYHSIGTWAEVAPDTPTLPIDITNIEHLCRYNVSNVDARLVDEELG